MTLQIQSQLARTPSWYFFSNLFLSLWGFSFAALLTPFCGFWPFRSNRRFDYRLDRLPEADHARNTWSFTLLAWGPLYHRESFPRPLIYELADKNIAAARNSTWRWRWKWTWCGLSALFVLFLIGMAVGGAIHQIGWIAANPEPLMQRKGGIVRILGIMEMKKLADACQLAFMGTTKNVRDARREMWDSRSTVFDQPALAPSLMQTYHVLLIMEGEDKVAGYIIFPRENQRRSFLGAEYSFEEITDHIEAQKLPNLLQKHQGRLVAL